MITQRPPVPLQILPSCLDVFLAVYLIPPLLFFLLSFCCFHCFLLMGAGSTQGSFETVLGSLSFPFDFSNLLPFVHPHCWAFTGLSLNLFLLFLLHFLLMYFFLQFSFLNF